MPTPHNTAKVGEIAKTVLMPGDPLRAKYVAENYLTDYKLVSSVRNMYAFTGKYQGKDVTVMGSGMGCGSIGIYSWELYNFYDVDQIIRIGSAGGIGKGLQLMDIIIGQAAATNSNYAHIFNLPGIPAFCGDFGLIEKAVAYGRAHQQRFSVGALLSSDCFYGCDEETKRWQEFGVLGVEMEAATLYANAMHAGKKALAICTVSDLMNGEELIECTPEERQTGFTGMMEMALSLVE